MSAGRWTKGPWRIEQDDTGRRTVRATTRRKVVTLDTNTTDADARLIAAAPEMVEELRAVCDALGSAEWGTPEHAADLLAKLVERHHSRIGTLLAKAVQP